MQHKYLRILIGIAALAAVVFVLNYIAGLYYLYWVFWWYDIMMHFVTGAVVGAFVAWGVLRFRADVSLSALFGIVFISIMVIGIGWEIFEYVTGAFIGESDILFDTLHDIVMDTLGAFFSTAILTLMFDTSHTSLS